MSRRIFRDIEEAIQREIRRITFHDQRTVDDEGTTVLESTFDPFTGELVELPIEADFYDSSADTSNRQYPHFFVRLLQTREDRYTKRVVPQYGKWCTVPVKTSPKAFEIVTSGSDAIITAPSSTIETSLFQISKVEAGQLLRLQNGNNKGTYIIDSVVKDAGGNHTITVSNTLNDSLPTLTFIVATRIVIFDESVDLNTIKVGDTFTDFSSNTFNITAVDINSNSITIDGTLVPDGSDGGTLERVGDMFTEIDPSLVRYLVMDPTSPVKGLGIAGEEDRNSAFIGKSPEVPLDAYYLIRIDSKDRNNHIDVLNRVWEEFNPPRTALPIIKRTALSGEELLTADLPSGGSDTVEVADNSEFNVGDEVFVFDDLLPTKDNCGKFPEPFKSKVVELIGTDSIRLENVVPDTFELKNCPKIVSNAEFRTFMFHFVGHNTKDVEGSQYWVHEFTFWVQLWVDRLEDAEETGVVTDTESQIENITDGHIFSPFGG